MVWGPRCVTGPPAHRPRRAHSIGRNIEKLVERDDEKYCFRLHKDRVYYVSERLLAVAAGFARPAIAGLGTCFGKFTHGRAFHLQITCLEHLAQFAKVRGRRVDVRGPCR